MRIADGDYRAQVDLQQSAVEAARVGAGRGLPGGRAARPRAGAQPGALAREARLGGAGSTSSRAGATRPSAACETAGARIRQARGRARRGARQPREDSPAGALRRHRRGGDDGDRRVDHAVAAGPADPAGHRAARRRRDLRQRPDGRGGRRQGADRPGGPDHVRRLSRPIVRRAGHARGPVRAGRPGTEPRLRDRSRARRRSVRPRAPAREPRRTSRSSSPAGTACSGFRARRFWKATECSSLRDGRLESRPVEIGLKNWQFAEIRTGLVRRETRSSCRSTGRRSGRARASRSPRSRRGDRARRVSAGTFASAGGRSTRCARSTSPIPDGDYCSIMGPSGSGKSTLLNILGCLDRPTAGSYRLDGQEVAQLDDDALSHIRRHRIGFVFQFYHLVPRLTAAGNVELPMIFAGVERARAGGARGAGARGRRPVGPGRSPVRAALGRRAAARGDRARGRHGAVAAARRRADREPRHVRRAPRS